MSEQHSNEVEAMVKKIDEVGFEAFQNVIALGRWPNGEKLLPEQTPIAMQALLVFEHKNVPLEQRTGFIYKSQCASKTDK